MVFDGDDMEHLSRPNVDAYLAMSNSLIEGRESGNGGV